MSRASTVRLLLLALIWGSGFFFIAVALRRFPPILLTFARLALGAGVLVPFVLAREGGLPRGRRLWGHLTLAALLSNAVPYTLFALAETDVPSSVAGVINSTTPLWVLLFDQAAGARRPRPTRLAGLAMGFAGTLVIFAPWAAGASVATWGGLACLVASASYGVSYVYQHRFLTPRGHSPLALSAGQLLAATALMALTVPFADLRSVHLRGDAVAALIVLGGLGTGAGYVLNFRLIRDEGPAASIVTYLIPVVAVIFGAFGLSEALTAHVLIGVAVVLLGVALAQAPLVAPPDHPLCGDHAHPHPQ
jgi:drug/metabolite transporter (DMT)-like permease